MTKAAPVVRTRIAEIQSFTTADGSTIRELMHPGQHGNQNQSLAEATIAAGSETRLHIHMLTEELYHITEGRGEMTLGDNEFTVTRGDTIYIKPGTPHRIRNIDKVDLKLLCCCSPRYSHADTELLDD